MAKAKVKNQSQKVSSWGLGFEGERMGKPEQQSQPHQKLTKVFLCHIGHQRWKFLCSIFDVDGFGLSRKNCD
jgi:hypothetical protein